MLKRLLSFIFNERGEVAVGDPPANAPPANTPWFDSIPDTVTYEHEGKPVPIKTLQSIKETPDVGTLAKRFLDSQAEIGRRVRMPGKDAKPEDRQAFVAEMRKNGILESPPDSFDKYEVHKPDKMPEGIVWNDENLGSFKKVAHELGLTNAQAQRLIDFQAETMGAIQTGIAITIDEGMKSLKDRWGTQFEANQELAGRAAHTIFSGDDAAISFIEKSGIGNHPQFLDVMARVGKLMQEDDTLLPAPSLSKGDDLREELAKLYNSEEWKKSNPKAIARAREINVALYGTDPVGQNTIKVGGE